MRFGRLFPALSVFVAAGALIVLTGTGAAAPQPGRSAPAAISANLAAPAALDATLRSLGVSRASLVTQRGARNYAGPNCPGKGWNCTTSTRVLQISTNGGQNKVDCPGFDFVGKSPQSCIVVQVGPNNNSARCQQRSDSSAAKQRCSITQTGKKNVAHVDQSVHASGSDEQSATQTAKVDQTSTGSGGNQSTIDQSVKQSTLGGDGGDDDEDDEDDEDDDDGGGPPAALVQTQNAHQSALVDQDAAGSGDNSSRVNQSERLKARGGVDQTQNTGPSLLPDCAFAIGSPSEPNACANIRQTSEAGDNDSRLKQSIKEDAKSRALGGSQQQGSFSGGIDGQVHQFTVDGSSSNRADQDKRQRLSAPPGTSQSQVDPVSCCGFSSQDGGTGNSEEIKQSSSQDADADASQNSLLTGTSRSPSGSCSVEQKASNNFDTGGNSASFDPPCPAIVVTTSCFASGGEGEPSGDCTQDEPVVIIEDDCEFCEGFVGGGGIDVVRLGRQNR